MSKTDWRVEYMSSKPNMFEKISDDTYIQRRNIKKNPDNDANPTLSQGAWMCESRFISKDVYEDYMDVLEGPAQNQIVTSLTEVQSSQTSTDENTLILMLGTADLYEKLSELVETAKNVMDQMKGGE